jgi:hypothetical protein
MDRDILAVANVSEVQEIAVGVDAKDYAVILADKKTKVVETVSDLVSGIWDQSRWRPKGRSSRSLHICRSGEPHLV